MTDIATGRALEVEETLRDAIHRLQAALGGFGPHA
jgi:hypothetical protein